jgi:Ni/Co efflux regulator RcnB
VVRVKGIRKAIALTMMCATLPLGTVLAQDHRDDRRDDHHDNHHYVRHDEWRKGQRMRQEDWSRGERIDYRHYHLHRPPRGYEWREVDGNYVLAAVATGIIASTIVASAAH